MYIAEFNSEPLQITNQKIVTFYKSNPQIDIETINLAIIDLLQKNTTNSSVIENVKILYPEEHKIKEIESFLTNIRNSMNRIIQVISSKYIIIKTEYIRDFKSASKENDLRDLSYETNRVFFDKMSALLSILYPLRVSNTNEKIKVLLGQFNKILTSNTEHIFATPNITRNMEEYINNFESNTTHMIQAIIKLLSDCVTSYEVRVNMVNESIRKQEDPSFTNYYKLIYELNDTLHQLPSTLEDMDNVGIFEQLLSRTFTTASIQKEANANEYILDREDKPTIYIETHDIREHNVGVSDVKKFIKRAIDKNSNSILISQYTGITSKPNYHIEIHNNIVVIFLHKMLYSSETIQIATDMIDALSAKLNDFCSLSENKYSIPKDILDNINREYQQFIMQKESIITAFKDHQKRILIQLDDIRFGALDKYLSTRYSSCKKQGYNCDLCNNFNVGTLKGLAAHKRGCARKIKKLPAEEECELIKQTI